MKKFFTLIAVAVMAFAAQAASLTVANGSAEAEFAPFYGMFMDTQGATTQTIYPASVVANMDSISGIAEALYSLRCVFAGIE